MPGLAISCINESCTYAKRKHVINRYMQRNIDKAECLKQCKQIVRDQAKKEKTQFGSVYKQKDIIEATEYLFNYHISHFWECIDYDENKQIVAICRRWWDKVNGNSYFSVFVEIPNKDGSHSQFVIPFQYGYESQWEFETINTLAENRIVELDKNKYNREYNIYFKDQGYKLKRDAFGF